MLDVTIKRLLELHPRGVSNGQLLWRLRDAGLRVHAEELLFGLRDLSERGEIARDRHGRWRDLSREISDAVAPDGRGAGSRQINAPASAHGSLSAVRFAIEKVENEIELDQSKEQKPQPGLLTLPEPAKLLSYYAATLRQDPRGRVAEFPDRHGTGWQIVQTQGHWWSEVKLRAPMSALPEGFQEALSRRRPSYASVGWPLTIFSTPEGAKICPGLLLPASLELLDDDLILKIDGGAPSINAHWLAEMRRRTAWTATDLMDALFPAGEDDDLGAASGRMRHALATRGGALLKPGYLAAHLDLGVEGLSNSAAVFLPDDTTFTRAAANDLESMAAWPAEDFQSTALGPLFAQDGEDERAKGAPVLAAEACLTDRQMDAVETGLSNLLTVIQGPPGTGKSHVVLTIMLSAFLSGRSVLFASKNHQALDEVERRIREIAPDLPLLTRGRDSEGERDTNFLKELSQIAEGDVEAVDDPAIHREVNALLEAAGLRASIRETRRTITDLNLQLCDLVERRDAQAASRDILLQRRPNILARSFMAIWCAFRPRVVDFDQHLSSGARGPEINARIKAIHEQLTALEAEGAAMSQIAESPLEDPNALGTLAHRWAKQSLFPDEASRLQLLERVNDLEFDQNTRANRIDPPDAQRVLSYRPLWAVSALAVPARVPLIPGLFDYVIFDEASQCDVASALPLFARAKRAIVVGDPMQLGFIPGVGKSTEHALMDAVGIPPKGRGRFAQSRVSLFRFCADRPMAKRFFLKDQFRSAPEIIDYLNSEFYTRDGLEGRREATDFKSPKDYKPGISWDNVPGQVSREDGGNVNIAEARRIGALLRALADDRDFKGTVGVLSPFNAQVAQIQKVVSNLLSEAERERFMLRVASIDKFQGGEADVIFFSLVVAQNAPHSARAFLQKERRRLNVAISRARALCVVVGDLAYAKRCGIRHIANLANRATNPTQKTRPPFDSVWERRLAEAMRRRNISFILQ